MTQQVVRLSQKSVEWHTPARYIELARRAMGGEIDLDPASCEIANRVVRAACYFTQEQDGLLRPWPASRLWLNPPYCKTRAGESQQEIWTCKLIAEFNAGRVEQAVALVNASPSPRWFQRLFSYPLCFPKGKIKFHSPSGIASGPTVGSAFVYFGEQPERFVEVFRSLGPVIVPERRASLDLPQLWRVQG
jgi:ParB family chromosome partitioning protein